MPTYNVPASAIPSGGFAVSNSYNIVDLSLQKQLVVVDAEAGTARLASAGGSIVAEECPHGARFRIELPAEEKG